MSCLKCTVYDTIAASPAFPVSAESRLQACISSGPHAFHILFLGLRVLAGKGKYKQEFARLAACLVAKIERDFARLQ